MLVDVCMCAVHVCVHVRVCACVRVCVCLLCTMEPLLTNTPECRTASL